MSRSLKMQEFYSDTDSTEDEGSLNLSASTNATFKSPSKSPTGHYSTKKSPTKSTLSPVKQSTPDGSPSSFPRSPTQGMQEVTNHLNVVRKNAEELNTLINEEGWEEQKDDMVRLSNLTLKKLRMAELTLREKEEQLRQYERRLFNAEEEIRVYQRRALDAEDKVRDLSEEKGRLARELDHQSSVEALEKKIGELTSEQDSLLSKLGHKDEMLASFDTQLKERKLAIEEYLTRIEQLETSLEEASGERARLSAKLDSHEQQAQLSPKKEARLETELTLARSEAEILQSKLASAEKDAETSREEFEALRAQLIAVKAEKEQLNREIERLNNENSSLTQHQLGSEWAKSRAKVAALAQGLRDRPADEGISVLAGRLSDMVDSTGSSPPPTTVNQMDREISQLAELLESAAHELQKKSEELNEERSDKLSAQRLLNDANAKVEAAEKRSKELIEKNRVLEIENSIAVEQLSKLQTPSSVLGSTINADVSGQWAGGASLRAKSPGPSRARSVASDHDRSSRATTPGRSQMRSTTPGRSVRSSMQNSLDARAMSPYRTQSEAMARLRTPQKNAAIAVDSMVSNLKARFAESDIDLPLYKVGDCVYKLGSRKVHLNVLSGKLVVRMGGGYCDFLEFLDRAKI